MVPVAKLLLDYNNINHQQYRQKTYYDRKQKGSAFELQDQVWVHFPATSRQQSCKLHCPWQGPFKVVKVIIDLTFRVQRTDHPRKRLVVHFNRFETIHSKGSTGKL